MAKNYRLVIKWPKNAIFPSLLLFFTLKLFKKKKKKKSFEVKLCKSDVAYLQRFWPFFTIFRKDDISMNNYGKLHPRMFYGLGLTKHREAAGLTMADLGRATGIHKSLISKYESCESVPNVENAIKLYNYLNQVIMEKESSTKKEGDI